MAWLAYVRGIYARSGVYARLGIYCPFLDDPPHPYTGGEVSESGPSRLQVYGNPN
jgi:hypothetical protein